MKKNLLCTSAIALGVVAAPAVAQEWDLAVHGYFNQHIGYADNSFKGNWASKPDNDEAVVMTNAEIHFTPSITLDNGLTFGVNVQLEADNNTGDDIDESYMEIKGERFGKLIMGSENSAGYKTMVGAPGVTSMYINSPSVSAYVPFSAVYGGGFRTAALSSYTEVAGNNDVQRITYFTPSFNGFVLGVSYAPSATAWTSGSGNNGIFDRKTSINDVIDVGASYNQSWGEFDVSFGARYGTASRGSGLGGKDPDTWGAGLQLGYMGFNFGGSYTSNDSGLNNDQDDSTGWSLGATYDMNGPWAFEALTYQGKYDSGIGGSKKSKYQAYRIGVSRDIGPGVDWDLYAVHVRADDGKSNSILAGDSPSKRKVKGYGIGTAINLSF